LKLVLNIYTGCIHSH